ncbi:unnamed protein product [Tuber melanosporum]|uniref:(Perigord truffle) hypothetical protein n=1 Tax=Tuber melanosporum (strain Mel28) TaxID=656061 RepID=D5G6X2_TUBMM|nr:uncharacterized protein GSTUM_00002368001 [Tuber melanosporum]CAZ80265.1 unnamed protein product [Tuber melanosporum]
MNSCALPSERAHQLPSYAHSPPSLRLHSRLASPPYSPQSPVRRKPVPRGPSSVVSPVGTQTPDQSPRQLYSDSEYSLPPDTDRSIKLGITSPAPFDLPISDSGEFVVRDLDRYPHGDSPSLAQRSWVLSPSGEVDIRIQQPSPRPYLPSPLVPNSSHARVRSDSSLSRSNTPEQAFEPNRRASSIMASLPHAAPNLGLPEGSYRTHSPSTSDVTDEMSKPRSPNGRFTSFFRWGSTSEQGGSSSTSVSDRGPSPVPSPKTVVAPSTSPSSRSIPPAIDIPLANARLPTGLHSDSGVSLAPPTPSSYEAIEEEVRLVSADLAASIRREMDLEDLVERLQAEAAERNGEGKRTSDYFSDAGSSTRYLDIETKVEVDVEKLTRKAEQEKSQVQVELLGKIQEERQRRKAMESRVRDLEEQVARVRIAQFLATDTSGRIKELEVTLDEAKRRLADERQMKENYEDLLTALRGELEEHRNERDNLRDEIVPQLRARMEGLESEASELQKLMYEHSRMQQELLNLKNENASLASTVRNQTRQSHRFSVPASGFATPTSAGPGLPMILNMRDKETLVEKVKDIEEQRDALHAALKSLRERQKYESRMAKERIRVLEAERDKALQQTNRRYGKDREMRSLWREMERLRQRADDALEQKFTCERGLGTLKMDLEKAEQETSSLRALLQEHDVLESQRAIERLRQSVAQAEAERDTAQVEAEAYRKRSESLAGSEKKHMAEERNLSMQLRLSTERIAELVVQVHAQLESNNALRDRLADAIGRGEEEQKMSAKRINELQGRLKELEDRVLEAQQETEDAVAKHEQEINQLKETHTSQLRRLKSSALRSPSQFGPRSPLLSPHLKSPKLEWTGSRKSVSSIPDEAKVEFLEKRVQELEEALVQADNEMAEVVSKMNMAQIEVLELQCER